MKVGVIGLGRMGAPIARHILSAGHELRVYDIRPPTLGTRCRDAAEVAQASEVLITSLPGPAEVQSTMAAIREVVRRGTVIVETSTIGPAQSKALAAEFAQRGAAYLDAPISGGVEGALAGTLAVMVGGDAAALERARPVIQCFSKEIFHLGPAGSGSSMKLVIQAAFFSQVAALVEVVTVGQEAGIPMQRLLEVLGASSAHHPAIAKRYPKLIAGDLTPRFELRLALKDLELAQDWARQTGCRADILASVIAAFGRAAAAGFAEQDLIALGEVVRSARP